MKTNKNIQNTGKQTKKYITGRSKIGKSKTGKSKKMVNTKIMKMNKTQIELLLLFHTLILYTTMLYINNNKSHQLIKKKLLELLKKIKKNNKFIPKDIPDTELENITNTIIQYTQSIIQEFIQISNKVSSQVSSQKNSKMDTGMKNHSGGFFFKNIEDKGEIIYKGKDSYEVLGKRREYVWRPEVIVAFPRMGFWQATS